MFGLEVGADGAAVVHGGCGDLGEGGEGTRQTVFLLPEAGQFGFVDGEEGEAAVVVAVVVGVRAGQGASDDAEVGQFGFVQQEFGGVEQRGVGGVLEEGAVVVVVAGGCLAAGIVAQGFGAVGGVGGQGDVVVRP